jgi:hypothetical protein
MDLPGAPPAECPGGLTVETLAPGTRLLRVHRLVDPALAFNPYVPEFPWEGGRFDNVRADDGHLYAGSDLLTSVAETLLRDLCSHGRAAFLPRALIAGKAVSTLEIVMPVTVLSMHGKGLISARIPPGVFGCEPSAYPTTREWSESLRRWRPDSTGIAWRSRFANDGLSYVLYSSSMPEGALTIAEGPVALDSGDGLARLLDTLRPLRFTVASP